MAKIQKAFKYRIYPDDQQKTFFAHHFGSARFIYNYFLNTKINTYNSTGQSSNYKEDSKELTKLKKNGLYPWLNSVNSQTLQASLKNLSQAYENFFNNKHFGFPKFHKKKSKQSFKIPQHFYIEGNYLFIPKLKTGIKIKLHRKFQGKVICCFISQTPSGKYYASILCEVAKQPLPESDKVIGIDLGIKNLITDSNGNIVENKRSTIKEDKEKAYLHKQLSKKKGDSSRAKAKILLAKAYEKQNNRKLDYLHKISKRIVNENQVIIVENLSIKDMMMKAPKGLSKSIGEVSWGEFVRQLHYKSDWYGRIFHKIDKYYPSSKTCNNCKAVVGVLPLEVRTWSCPSCGKELDRDENAARNILEKGLADLGLPIPTGFRDEILSQKPPEAEQPRLVNDGGSLFL